ncbi:MAG: lytic transglycosylase domain-containing protein, partial [Pseudomonadota bacterium]
MARFLLQCRQVAGGEIARNLCCVHNSRKPFITGFTKRSNRNTGARFPPIAMFVSCDWDKLTYRATGLTGVDLRMRRLAIIAVAIWAAAPISAQTVDPLAVAAIEEAEIGWNRAYLLAPDDLTKDVLTWLRLREGAARFQAYQIFVAEKPHWPGLPRLRAEAEQVIEKGHDPADVIAWFAEDPPQTGIGAVRLAEALMTSGEIEDAKAVLRNAWINLRLTEGGHDAMIAAFGDVLEPFHLARTDALLWASRRVEAERMLPLLDEDQQALAAARIGYIRRLRNMLPLYNAVPDDLREDAGLAYARYTWMANRGSREDAVDILLDRSTSRAALGEPFRWSGWRRSLARWEMREGRAERAYQVASRHYLTDGAAYADLEWLSGYIALTYLGDPTLALEHFEKALRVVSSPISLGRMNYWIGRTHEAKDQPELAVAAFAAAAEYQTGFYGLLASEKVGRALDAAFAGASTDGDDMSVFENDIARAALLLRAAGERGHAVTFFAHAGRILPPAALEQLGVHLNEMDEQYYTLLLGKTAAARGEIIPSIYFPLHDLAKMDLPVDPDLALAIARRESEFNIGIGSPAGALGLMQLMPA